MKSIIIIFFFAFCINATAQSINESSSFSKFALEVAPSANRTVYGWQFGAKIGVEYNARLRVGYIGTQAIGNSENGRGSFSGGYLHYIVNPNARLKFQPSLRVGFYDSEFLVFQPAIEAAYWLKSDLALEAGLGKVDGFMSFNFGCSWRLIAY